MKIIVKLLNYIIPCSFLILLFGFIFGSVYYSLFLEPTAHEDFMLESYKGVVTDTVFVRKGTYQLIYIKPMPHEILNQFLWNRTLWGKQEQEQIVFSESTLLWIGIPDLYNYIQIGDTITKFANSPKVLIQNDKRIKLFVAKTPLQIQQK